ncbi:hypothetical protein ACH415_04495 [Streptomyces californicus]|uniref:Uncharacterized protein n=1 Tax=Streptomyces globisporus TaxID=1908 RepID=A0A927BIC8_STRGL|nr:hypothetical protein [Streptomyces sp. MMG1522]KOU55457.1 hypothetical protein ADK56_02905 [Streptomyces sp. MMG1522]MBD2828193.1 hypothetical protein [Streptomyces globisporus]
MTVMDERTDHDDDQHIVWTAEEIQNVVRRELSELGLTYVELREQARRRDFSSAQANSLWVLIGDAVDL